MQIAVQPTETAIDVNDTAGGTSVRISQVSDFGRSPAISPGLLDQGAAGRAALKAGVLGVVISMIPVLGIVLTGSLAVYFYRREKGFIPATRIGWRLGSAAGVVSFAINALLIVIRVFALHAQQEYIDAVTKIAQMVGYNPADPDIQAGIHNLLTPAGMTLTLLFGMIFTVALAALGGALAAMLFRSGPRP
ncbi:MAG: hypothetical protein WA172_18480 [Terriglobales bacterium]